MGDSKNKAYEVDERGMTNNSARMVEGPQVESADSLGEQMMKKGLQPANHGGGTLKSFKQSELHDGHIEKPLSALGMQEVRMGGASKEEPMESSKPLSGLKKEKVKEFGGRAPKGMGRDAGKVSRYKADK